MRAYTHTHTRRTQALGAAWEKLRQATRNLPDTNTTETVPVGQGWAQPRTATKAHYFGAGGRSLCGSWFRSVNTPAVADDPDKGHLCVKCRRVLTG